MDRSGTISGGVRRASILGLLLLVGVGGAPGQLPAQADRALVGAGVGVAGGAVITLSAIVARARFQREYVDSVEDLLHWQSLPMVITPLVGVGFGLAGEEAQKGSIVGSTAGMLVGAAAGAGIGWMLSGQQESPWAGGVIGAGVGMVLGGVGLGLASWARDDDPDIEFPEFLRFGLSVPLP